MLFHGIDDCVNGDERHLTHLTQEVDCCVTERKKLNLSSESQDYEVPNAIKSRSMLYDSAKSNDRKEVYVGIDDCVKHHFDGCVDGCVDDSADVAVEDGVDGCVNGDESHLTCLTQEVDCYLMGRKKLNLSSECQDHKVLNATKSRSMLYDSAKSNDGKEIGETMLSNDVDDSVDGGDNHLTHFASFESNDGVGGCENFTHIVKSNSESFRSWLVPRQLVAIRAFFLL
eukprot:10145515-Ditylum_brightwellii.AAC.1